MGLKRIKGLEQIEMFFYIVYYKQRYQNCLEVPILANALSIFFPNLIADEHLALLAVLIDIVWGASEAEESHGKDPDQSMTPFLPLLRYSKISIKYTCSNHKYSNNRQPTLYAFNNISALLPQLTKEIFLTCCKGPLSP